MRNDIRWRSDWVARLTETEELFANLQQSQSMPYTIFYATDSIKQGTVNYQNETVTMSIETHLHGSGIWTVAMERTLQAVYDGLQATKRAETWGLNRWPQQPVTGLNAFARRDSNFTIVFELLDDQNAVIGSSTLQARGNWRLNNSGRLVVNVDADVRRTLNFTGVNANRITDTMGIRVATVNGTNAEIAARNGVLQVRAVPNDLLFY